MPAITQGKLEGDGSMKNDQEFRVLNDLSIQVMNMQKLKITGRPIKKKNGTQKRPSYNSNTRSNYDFDPVHDIDFKEFLELDTGVEFNSNGKMDPCPICGHNDCCSVMPDEPSLMKCFSDEHNEAFNIWQYMDQKHGLKGPEAIEYISNIKGIPLRKPSPSRYKRVPKLKLLSVAQIINDPRPKPVDLIGNGVLPVNSLLVITGPEKVYKSMISVNMGLHLASGCDWLGNPISKTYRCIVLNAEGGYFSMRERLTRMVSGFNKPFDRENLLLSEEVSLNLLESDDYMLLTQSLEKNKPDVLVIDPLVRFHDAEENSANEMAAVMGLLRELIHRYDISIVLIHHGNKGGGPARGSSVTLGEYDSMMHLTKVQDHGRPVINVKYSLRHAENPPDMKLQFHPETFSFGQHRKQSSTAREAIVVQLEAGGMERKELKAVFLDVTNHSEKTFNNEVRKMIKKGQVKDSDKFLELSSQGS